MNNNRDNYPHYRSHVRVCKPPGGSTHDVFEFGGKTTVQKDNLHGMYSCEETSKAFGSKSPRNTPRKSIRTATRKNDESTDLKTIFQPDLTPAEPRNLAVRTGPQKAFRNESHNFRDTLNTNSTTIWHPYASYADVYRQVTGCRSPFVTVTDDMLKKRQEQQMVKVSRHPYWNSYVFQPDNEPRVDTAAQCRPSKKGQAYLLGYEIPYRIEKKSKSRRSK